MSKIRFITLMVFLMLFFASCATPVPQYAPERALPSGSTPEPGYSMSSESGNWSWIALNIDYKEGETIAPYIPRVGNAISTWEREHPDRCILDVDIYHEDTAYGPATLYGVSIFSYHCDMTSICVCP